MSAIFEDFSFEDKLKTAFRGSAKEQQSAIKKLRKERSKNSRLSRFVGTLALTPKPTLGASSNVFKSNLGGIQGFTR